MQLPAVQITLGFLLDVALVVVHSVSHAVPGKHGVLETAGRAAFGDGDGVPGHEGGVTVADAGNVGFVAR